MITQDEISDKENVKALKNKIKNNTEFNDFQKDLAGQIVDLAQADRVTKEYEILLRKYQEHPLIQNFEIVKEDVYRILTEVKEIIEK